MIDSKTIRGVMLDGDVCPLFFFFFSEREREETSPELGGEDDCGQSRRPSATGLLDATQSAAFGWTCPETQAAGPRTKRSQASVSSRSHGVCPRSLYHETVASFGGPKLGVFSWTPGTRE
ncbi:hypothetical protein BHM03_00061708 [Ensete ventricosum]|nr:hypothetical protein BHM03_00061708 [Ensete ventricosum]